MEWHNFVFPVLLLCGFFGIILLVGIGSTYLWLVWLDKEATKCPKCGKKGAGELVETKVLQSRVYTEWKDAWGILGRDPSRRQLMQVTEKTCEYRFECEYCGHQWTTTAQERKRSAR